MTGLPGTAKTLMVHTIAETLGLKFRRIQFTPDLMPSDITGTDIIEEDLTTGHRKWTFVEGPIFGNVLLADEINRTPPKTQSALLEAVQECSCIASRSADCVLGGVRLISSASNTFPNIGPSTKVHLRWPVVRSSSMMSVPVISEGIKSGVNWIRRNFNPSVSAIVCTINVFAVPGKPVMRQ